MRYSCYWCLGSTSVWGLSASWYATIQSSSTGQCALQVRVGDQTQITNVLWQSINPEWEESLFFREICAASELVVEVSRSSSG